MANAGVYEFGMLGEITEEQFDKTFNTDVRGLLFTVQKALPLLAQGSSVILTGSMVSIKGFASCSVCTRRKRPYARSPAPGSLTLRGATSRQRVEPRIHRYAWHVPFHDE